ncbi:uncharacterized protein OCT59_012928 [Rhizophagus irregularis]|uniref:uncharacterized protein n=1 Tax=Rhizophagus irregularis TaxID=588596 RepID=UPI0033321DBE|nr:hypothetical protein OCT59_012928 [Rhizophagus irregularis]
MVIHFGFWTLAWNFFFVDIYVSVSGLGIFLSCQFPDLSLTPISKEVFLLCFNSNLEFRFFFVGYSDLLIFFFIGHFDSALFPLLRFFWSLWTQNFSVSLRSLWKCWLYYFYSTLTFLGYGILFLFDYGFEFGLSLLMLRFDFRLTRIELTDLDFRFRPSDLGHWIYGFRLPLDIWVSAFGYWALNRFQLLALRLWIIYRFSWALDIWISDDFATPELIPVLIGEFFISSFFLSSGKSTLANVLTGTNQFKESNYSISQTKAIQRCQFVEEEITYEVIDTIGLNDTKLNREDILYKLVELAHELKDGLHQILLVTNGRFTEEEIQVYQILETVLFDENVKNYTTIVRINFEKFENEEECQKIKDY